MAKTQSDFKTLEFKKSLIISPELIEINKEYTFNLSPNDDLQFWDKDNRESLNIACMQTLVMKESLDIIINIYLELSRNGRLHWHGIIKFTTYSSIHQFYMRSVSRYEKRCRLVIQVITDPKIWETYIHKYQHISAVCIKSPTFIRSKKIQRLRINHDSPTDSE